MKAKKNLWIGIGLILAITLLVGATVIPWAKINPFYMSRDERVRRMLAKDQMVRLATALESYKNDNGFYPTTEQGLDALVISSTISPIPKHFYKEGYINRLSVPKDPWGRAYEYSSPDGKYPYTIRSKGRVAWYGGDDLTYPERDSDTLAKTSTK